MDNLKRHSTAIRVCVPIAVIILANGCNLNDFLHSRGGVFNAIVTAVYLVFWGFTLESQSKLTVKSTIAVGALTFVSSLLVTLQSLTGVGGAGVIALPLAAPLYGAIVFFNKSASAMPACLTQLTISALWLAASIVAYKRNHTHNN